MYYFKNTVKQLTKILFLSQHNTSKRQNGTPKKTVKTRVLF